MARILVIDDYEPFRRSLRILLEQAGHTIWDEQNGAAGIRNFAENQPDLVITDLFMPEKDGIEAIMAFRRQRPNIPIIAISGGTVNFDLDILGVAKCLGATKVLSKPVENQEILRAVQECLS